MATASCGACVNSFSNSAVPPPEVVVSLEQHGFSRESIDAMAWYAHPKLGEPRKGRSRRELSASGQVDAQELMEPLLSESGLRDSLRTADVLNGCFNQCGTCYADAPLPTSMFSLGSWRGLFRDRRFVEMVQIKSLRLGAVGDLMNHPQAIEILEASLDAAKAGHPRRIKVVTCYQPRTEKELDEILKLARLHPDHLDVLVSLPFNINDTINLSFEEYVKRRPDVFYALDLHRRYCGLRTELHVFSETRLANVEINDTRHCHGLVRCGRVLSSEALSGRMSVEKFRSPEEYCRSRKNVGLVKTFLNPDALWLKIYATIFESHTEDVFTPITNQTLSALQYLEYHPDFKTPYWPGGVGQRKAYERPENAIPRPVVVVG